MDVWVAIGPGNAAQVSDALVAFGFSPEDVPPSLFAEAGKVVRMGVPPMRLEIITTISGVEFEACYGRRTVDRIDGVPVNIIGLEDLKTNKKASGRHKDLNDLEQLA